MKKQRLTQPTLRGWRRCLQIGHTGAPHIPGQGPLLWWLRSPPPPEMSRSLSTRRPDWPQGAAGARNTGCLALNSQRPMGAPAGAHHSQAAWGWTSLAAPSLAPAGWARGRLRPQPPLALAAASGKPRPQVGRGQLGRRQISCLSWHSLFCHPAGQLCPQPSSAQPRLQVSASPGSADTDTLLPSPQGWAHVCVCPSTSLCTDPRCPVSSLTQNPSPEVVGASTEGPGPRGGCGEVREAPSPGGRRRESQEAGRTPWLRPSPSPPSAAPDRENSSRTHPITPAMRRRKKLKHFTKMQGRRHDNAPRSVPSGPRATFFPMGSTGHNQNLLR